MATQLKAPHGRSLGAANVSAATTNYFVNEQIDIYGDQIIKAVFIEQPSGEQTDITLELHNGAIVTLVSSAATSGIYLIDQPVPVSDQSIIKINTVGGVSGDRKVSFLSRAV